MADKICSFFGHRKIEVTKRLKKDLETLLIDLINNGFNKFYFGGFSEFDDLCYKIITKLKIEYISIERIFCIADKRWQRENKRPEWLNLNNYEQIIYLEPSFDYWYQKIYYRNCAMIDKSDFIIFYLEHTNNSGVYKAYQYAKRNKKNFINIIDNI